MKDIGLLMDAVYAAYNLALGNGPFHPIAGDGGITTFCNEAVNMICRRVGYDKFDRSNANNPWGCMLADQMLTAMKNPAGDWRQLSDGIAAQACANAGFLVVSGFLSPTGHGHVCVVIPGIVESSASLGAVVPKVMNVGKDVFIGQKLSKAFTLAEAPGYFTLKDGVIP